MEAEERGRFGDGAEDACLRSPCRGALASVWGLIYSFREPIKNVSSFALINDNEASGRAAAPRANSKVISEALREPRKIPVKVFGIFSEASEEV